MRCQGMHDRVLLELPGIKMKLERCASDSLPHEVTLVLPRIEIRRTTKSGAAETTEEYIYSSVTVVHAPRHPEEGRRPSQSMGFDDRRLGPRQSSHPEQERRQSDRSMDNTRAMLYTLRRWPALHSGGQPRNATRGKEADDRVLDRRDIANR